MERPDLYVIHENLVKLKEEGKKIIGVLPHSIVPDELIHAAGCIPLHFCLGGTEDQMNTGHAYVSQTTCGFQRVNLGIFDEGESISSQIYNLIDLLISGTFCNGVQNTAMYLENYFEKESFPFIIPHTNKTDSLRFYLTQLVLLKEKLEKITNNKITTDKIQNSIVTYNKLRKIYQEIDKFRFSNNPIISLSSIQNLIYHLKLNGPNLNMDKANEFHKMLLNNNLPEKKGIRVFLTGSGITLEDKFISIIEDCNCMISGDDLCSGFEFFSSLVKENENDPFVALADRYLNSSLTGRMIPDTYRINMLLKEYNKRDTKGIINSYLKFCDSYSNSADFFKIKMNRKNIQVLNLERDYSENSIGQLKTRIEAFLEILGG